MQLYSLFTILRIIHLKIDFSTIGWISVWTQWQIDSHLIIHIQHLRIMRFNHESMEKRSFESRSGAVQFLPVDILNSMNFIS